MRKRVKWTDLWQYFEVREITERRDGAVYKTKTRGFIHQDDLPNLDREKFFRASLSTQLTKMAMADGDVELEMFQCPSATL